MKAAHLENEINPFAPALYATYAWISRKGHWLRSLLVLLDIGIGRGRLEKSRINGVLDAPFEFKRSNRIDLVICAAIELILLGIDGLQAPLMSLAAIQRIPNLSTVHSRALRSVTPHSHAILDVKRLGTARGSLRLRLLALALILLLILLAPLPNPARPSSVKISFRTVQSLIVLEGKINGNPAIFLLDTGSNRTLINAKSFGPARFDLQRMPRRTGGAGFMGSSLRRLADVELADNIWAAQQVSVMDLDELQQMLHMDFDGLLGQDFLRQFRSVRIDYHAHVIELQQ